MKVIADVKAENTRLKQASLRSLDTEHEGSVMSTPKSFGGASVNSGVSTRTSHRQQPLASRYPLRRGDPGPSRATSRPASGAKPESVTSTRSAPVMPSLPGMKFHGPGSSVSSKLDGELRNTFMNFDSDFMSAHPFVTDLIRGAPASTFEQASTAGQRTHFPAPLTLESIAVRTREEEQRAKERRMYLAKLYSGQDPSPGAPVVAAASASGLQQMPEKGEVSGRGRNFQSEGVKESSTLPHRPAGAAEPAGGSLLNKNVLRDLRAFYDLQPVDRELPLPPPSSALLPWDVAVLCGDAFSGAVVSGPPAPLNVSALQSLRGSQSSGVPSVSSVTTASAAAGQAQQLVCRREGPSLLLGAGDAQRHYLRERPYDFGGPPSLELLPASSGGRSGAASSGTDESTSTSRLQAAGPPPLDDLFGTSGKQQLTMMPDVSGYSPTRGKPPVSGRRAVPMPNAGTSSSRDLLFPLGSGNGSVGVSRPVAPAGGSGLRGSSTLLGSYNGSAELFLAAASGSSPKSQQRSAAGGRPVSGTASIDGSVDGDEMAELLSWANNLNPRDAFGI
jgi:hypothetical protein